MKIKGVHCSLPHVVKSQVWTQKTLKATRFLKKMNALGIVFLPPSGFKSTAMARFQGPLPHAGLENCLKRATRAEAAIPPNLWMTAMFINVEVPDWKPPPRCHRLPCPDSLPDSKSETWLILLPHLLFSQLHFSTCLFLFFCLLCNESLVYPVETDPPFPASQQQKSTALKAAHFWTGSS